MSYKKWYIVFLMFVMAASAISGEADKFFKPDLGKKISTCINCGADIYENMMTKVDLILKGKDPEYACSLPCAIKLIDNSDRYADMYVKEYYSGRMISAANAIFVLGGNHYPANAIFPVMVFDRQDRAVYFVSQHGGSIFGTESILKLARENSVNDYSRVFYPEPGEKIGVCYHCEQPVYEKQLSRLEIITDKGIVNACGLKCAKIKMDGGNLSNIRVINFTTGFPFGMEKAWFVINSNVLLNAGKMPVLAFKEKMIAEEFIKIHRGKLLTSVEIIEFMKKVSDK
ncbi:MAG: nitrous oxide reductase accessory protein NosL [Calditrichaceae bacterium]